MRGSRDITYALCYLQEYVLSIANEIPIRREEIKVLLNINNLFFSYSFFVLILTICIELIHILAIVTARSS